MSTSDIRGCTLAQDLNRTANGNTQIVNDYFRNTYQINPAAKKKLQRTL